MVIPVFYENNVQKMNRWIEIKTSTMTYRKRIHLMNYKMSQGKEWTILAPYFLSVYQLDLILKSYKLI